MAWCSCSWVQVWHCRIWPTSLAMLLAHSWHTTRMKADRVHYDFSGGVYIRSYAEPFVIKARGEKNNLFDLSRPLFCEVFHGNLNRFWLAAQRDPFSQTSLSNLIGETPECSSIFRSIPSSSEGPSVRTVVGVATALAFSHTPFAYGDSAIHPRKINCTLHSRSHNGFS